jgi:hypothetical protein
MMRFMLVLCGGLCVVLAGAAHLYVRLRLRPPEDPEETYHEFEDQDPAYARYTRWLQWTFGAISAGVLLLFLAIVL